MEYCYLNQQNENKNDPFWKDFPGQEPEFEQNSFKWNQQETST